MEAGDFQFGDTRFAQAGVAFLVCTARAHRADVGDGEPQRELQQGHVELGVMGEDAQHGTAVRLGRSR